MVRRNQHEKLHTVAGLLVQHCGFVVLEQKQIANPHTCDQSTDFNVFHPTSTLPTSPFGPQIDRYLFIIEHQTDCRLECRRSAIKISLILR